MDFLKGQIMKYLQIVSFTIKMRSILDVAAVSLSLITKRSILDVAAALDPPPSLSLLWVSLFNKVAGWSLQFY